MDSSDSSSSATTSVSWLAEATGLGASIVGSGASEVSTDVDSVTC